MPIAPPTHPTGAKRIEQAAKPPQHNHNLVIRDQVDSRNKRVDPAAFLRPQQAIKQPVPALSTAQANQTKATIEPPSFRKQIFFEEFIARCIEFSIANPNKTESKPERTKSGVNGSYFLKDSKGNKCAVFKLMHKEAGCPGNSRLNATQNVQFRKGILPGQGVGNEVLAYGLDAHGFQNHYGLPHTHLAYLEHPALGKDLGSVQRFMPGCVPLHDLNEKEIEQIPQQEWEKLNFRLISGSTDAHTGNILYNKTDEKLYLIDSGDDFVGEEGQCQYYNPWADFKRSSKPMSQNERQFLADLDIWKIMGVFEKQAYENKRFHPLLSISVDKFLTQALRLHLAKAAGQHGLTQAQWKALMNHNKNKAGQLEKSALEIIYDEHLSAFAPLSQEQLEAQQTYRSEACPDWREAAKKVDWQAVQQSIEAHIQQRFPETIPHQFSLSSLESFEF